MEALLKDMNCIITGAGRGIGRAAALLFAKEGGRVLVADLDQEPAEEVVAEIRKAGGTAVPFVGNVCAEDFPNELVKTVAENFGPRIDVIVNNAGFTWDGALHKMSDEQWETMLRVHITAPFRILRAAAPYIRDVAKKEIENEGKSIARKVINVSSLAGLDGNGGQVNYSSAKSAIVGFTKTLAKEWGPLNVCVNAVAYGVIGTRLTQSRELGATIKAGEKELVVGVSPQILQAVKTLCPLGRVGTPEEAASAILFLASPLSNYITGEVLRVSGGVSL